MPQLNSFNYRVYYEDTDCEGIVYYANYLKFFERARTDFLRSRNITQTKLVEDEGLIFVVKRCEIDYFLPAKLDDLVEVSVKILEIKSASMLILQEARLGTKILSTLKVVIVAIDNKNFRPVKIPLNIKESLNNA